MKLINKKSTGIILIISMIFSLLTVAHAQDRTTGIWGIIDLGGDSGVQNVVISVTESLGDQTITNPDGNGYYSFSNLPVGTYSLTASLLGYTQYTQSNITIDGTGNAVQIDISLTSNTGTVSGTVTLSGYGNGNVEDVDLLLSQGGTMLHVFNNIVESDGSYAFDYTAGIYEMRAELSGYYSSSDVSVTIVQNSSVNNIDFTLLPKDGTIPGEITLTGGADDPLLTDFDFIIFDVNVGINVNSGDYTIGAVYGGGFEIEIAPGEYNITVSLDGYTNDTISEIVVLQEQESQDANFSLYKTPLISGQINLNGGSGSVSQAEVSLGGLTVSPDASGMYYLPGLTPGTYTVDASMVNYSDGSLSGIIVNDGDEITGQDITLDPTPGFISGQITLNQQQRVGDVTQVIFSVVNISNSPVVPENIDIDLLGNYVLEFDLTSQNTPWPLQVTASLQNYASDTHGYVTIFEGQTTTDVNFTLDPDNASISGTVTTNGGSAPLNPQFAIISLTVNDISYTDITDSSGNYGISDINIVGLITPLSVQITTTFANYQTKIESILLNEGQNTTYNPVIYPNPAEVNGHLSLLNGSGDIADASFIINGFTILTTEFTNVTGTEADYHLTVDLAGILTPANVWMHASLTGYQNSENVNVVLSEAQPFVVPSIGLIYIPYGWVSCNVSLNGGSGNLQEVTFNIYDSNGQLTEPNVITPAGNGNYTIELITGVFSISAMLDGYFSDNSGNVAIYSGQTVDLNFTLDPAGTLEGTVTLTGAGDVANVVIIAYDVLDVGHLIPISSTHPLGSGQTSMYSMDLLPGVYQVAASLTNYSKSTASPITINVQQTTTQDFTLSQSCEITGSVTVNSSSHTFDPVWVELLDNNMNFIAGQYADATGQYTLDGGNNSTQVVRASVIGLSIEVYSFFVPLNQLNYTVDQTLTLNPLGWGTLSGAIDNTDGTVIDGVRIELGGTIYQPIYGTLTYGWNDIGLLGGNGYTIEVYIPNTEPSTTVTVDAYNVQGVPAVPSAQEAEIYLNQTTTVNFEFMESIEGNVILNGGSGLVTNVSITANGMTVNPDANGDYFFPAFPADDYLVTATLTDYSGITATAIVALGSTTNLDISLDPLPATITGTLTFDGGQGTVDDTEFSIILTDNAGVTVPNTITWIDINGVKTGEYSINVPLLGSSTPFIVDLSFEHDDYYDITPLPLQLSENQEEENNDFTLYAKPATITGRVTFDGGHGSVDDWGTELSMSLLDENGDPVINSLDWLVDVNGDRTGDYEITVPLSFNGVLPGIDTGYDATLSWAHQNYEVLPSDELTLNENIVDSNHNFDFVPIPATISGHIDIYGGGNYEDDVILTIVTTTGFVNLPYTWIEDITGNKTGDFTFDYDLISITTPFTFDYYFSLDGHFDSHTENAIVNENMTTSASDVFNLVILPVITDNDLINTFDFDGREYLYSNGSSSLEVTLNHSTLPVYPDNLVSAVYARFYNNGWEHVYSLTPSMSTNGMWHVNVNPSDFGESGVFSVMYDLTFDVTSAGTQAHYLPGDVLIIGPAHVDQIAPVLPNYSGISVSGVSDLADFVIQPNSDATITLDVSDNNTKVDFASFNIISSFPAGLLITGTNVASDGSTVSFDVHNTNYGLPVTYMKFDATINDLENNNSSTETYVLLNDYFLASARSVDEAGAPLITMEKYDDFYVEYGYDSGQTDLIFLDPSIDRLLGYWIDATDDLGTDWSNFHSISECEQLIIQEGIYVCHDTSDDNDGHVDVTDSDGDGDFDEIIGCPAGSLCSDDWIPGHTYKYIGIPNFANSAQFWSDFNMSNLGGWGAIQGSSSVGTVQYMDTNPPELIVSDMVGIGGTDITIGSEGEYYIVLPPGGGNPNINVTVTSVWDDADEWVLVFRPVGCNGGINDCWTEMHYWSRSVNWEIPYDQFLDYYPDGTQFEMAVMGCDNADQFFFAPNCDDLFTQPVAILNIIPSDADPIISNFTVTGDLTFDLHCLNFDVEATDDIMLSSIEIEWKRGNNTVLPGSSWSNIDSNSFSETNVEFCIPIEEIVVGDNYQFRVVITDSGGNVTSTNWNTHGIVLTNPDAIIFATEVAGYDIPSDTHFNYNGKVSVLALSDTPVIGAKLYAKQGSTWDFISTKSYTTPVTEILFSGTLGLPLNNYSEGNLEIAILSVDAVEDPSNGRVITVDKSFDMTAANVNFGCLETALEGEVSIPAVITIGDVDDSYDIDITGPTNGTRASSVVAGNFFWNTMDFDDGQYTLTVEACDSTVPTAKCDTYEIPCSYSIDNYPAVIYTMTIGGYNVLVGNAAEPEIPSGIHEIEVCAKDEGSGVAEFNVGIQYGLAGGTGWYFLNEPPTYVENNLQCASFEIDLSNEVLGEDYHGWFTVLDNSNNLTSQIEVNFELVDTPAIPTPYIVSYTHSTVALQLPNARIWGWYNINWQHQNPCDNVRFEFFEEGTWHDLGEADILDFNTDNTGVFFSKEFNYTDFWGPDVIEDANAVDPLRAVCYYNDSVEIHQQSGPEFTPNDHLSNGGNLPMGDSDELKLFVGDDNGYSFCSPYPLVVAMLENYQIPTVIDDVNLVQTMNGTCWSGQIPSVPDESYSNGGRLSLWAINPAADFQISSSFMDIDLVRNFNGTNGNAESYDGIVSIYVEGGQIGSDNEGSIWVVPVNDAWYNSYSISEDLMKVSPVEEINFSLLNYSDLGTMTLDFTFEPEVNKQYNLMKLNSGMFTFETQCEDAMSGHCIATVPIEDVSYYAVFEVSYDVTADFMVDQPSNCLDENFELAVSLTDASAYSSTVCDAGFELQWDCGNGEGYFLETGNCASPVSVECMYNEPGFYDISMTVIGNGFEVEVIKTGIVEVDTVQDPQVFFITNGSTVFEEITFNSNSTGYSCGGTEIVPIDLYWYFGDGDCGVGFNSACEIGEIATHDYSCPGEYEVTLVGKIGDEIVAEYSEIITVTLPQDDLEVQFNGIVGAHNGYASFPVSLQYEILNPFVTGNIVPTVDVWLNGLLITAPDGINGVQITDNLITISNNSYLSWNLNENEIEIIASVDLMCGTGLITSTGTTTFVIDDQDPVVIVNNDFIGQVATLHGEISDSRSGIDLDESMLSLRRDITQPPFTSIPLSSLIWDGDMVTYVLVLDDYLDLNLIGDYGNTLHAMWTVYDNAGNFTEREENYYIDLEVPSIVADGTWLNWLNLEPVSGDYSGQVPAGLDLTLSFDFSDPFVEYVEPGFDGVSDSMFIVMASSGIDCESIQLVVNGVEVLQDDYFSTCTSLSYHLGEIESFMVYDVGLTVRDNVGNEKTTRTVFYSDEVDCAGTPNGSNVLISLWIDADGDGWGSGEPVMQCVDLEELPNGWATNGSDSNDSIDCPSNSIDDCGICNGPGKLTYFYDQDGDGQGSDISDEFCIGTVPPGWVLTTGDPYPTCNGIPDCAGICNGPTLLDCAGNCGGSASVDECGLCDDNPSNNGYTDHCGVCDNIASNDCVRDCNQDWGGTATLDDCGVCSGGDADHEANSDQDCAGVCFGDAYIDEHCGVCDDDPSNDDECIAFKVTDFHIAPNPSEMPGTFHIKTNKSFDTGRIQIYSFSGSEVDAIDLMSSGSTEIQQQWSTSIMIPRGGYIAVLTVKRSGETVKATTKIAIQ